MNYLRTSRAALVDFATALLLLSPFFAQGCSDSSSHGANGPPPLPLVDGIDQNPLVNYAETIAPATSAQPTPPVVWASAWTLSAVPHPSHRLTRSALRPGESNTPAQRLLEEVVLARPEADSRISPHAAGPPPGWTVVATVDRITLSMRTVTTTDQNGQVVQALQIDQQAEGLTDCARRVIWCRATDDAVTPEGSPLMAAYAHELRHAFVFEAALARGRTHDQAERESKAIDP